MAAILCAFDRYVPLPACLQALNLAWYRAGRDSAYAARAGRGMFRSNKVEIRG